MKVTEDKVEDRTSNMKKQPVFGRESLTNLNNEIKKQKAKLLCWN